MYVKEKSLLLKGSASALANNLSVSVNAEKTMLSYAIVYKSVVNLVTASTDGSIVNQRQIVCKEPSATHGHGWTIIIQCRLVQFPTRSVIVITSQRGIQMFEADGSLMLFWYALRDVDAVSTPDCFGRGICGVAGNSVCVGNHKGSILVLNVPSKGTNITLSETIQAHNAAICDLDSEAEVMVSSDDLGSLVVWKAGEPFQRLLKINGPGYPCSSVCMWRGLIVAGYSSGQLRVFNAASGGLRAEVAAHARWMTAVDVAPDTGLMISAAEDSTFHVWQLTSGDDMQISHVFTGYLPNVQIQGAKFISSDGGAIALIGYDSNELFFFRKT